jgi:hypothetical protein
MALTPGFWVAGEPALKLLRGPAGRDRVLAEQRAEMGCCWSPSAAAIASSAGRHAQMTSRRVSGGKSQ